MGNDLRIGKTPVTIQQDDRNLVDVLEVIDGRNVAREGVCANIFDGHHRLSLI